MFKKFKRTGALLICAAILSVIASGCGKDETSSKSSRVSTTASTDVTTQTQPATTTSKPKVDANQANSNSTYNDRFQWAYFREGDNKEVDVFMVAPTVDVKEELLMDVDDTENRERFRGALDMQKDIFSDRARIYAPYYCQLSLNGYELIGSDRDMFLSIAYSDVAEAFRYYLRFENKGRPFILAGFSQGADMCYRLMENFMEDEEVRSKLVATYAIGWTMDEETAAKYPYLNFAQSADDTGVIVSFECEAPELNASMICSANQKMMSINPLNWRTDNTIAKKDLNKGACFMKENSNEIEKEVPGICGCYLDPTRGTLKVTDIKAADYPAGIKLLPEGSYHIYDYQFFFRNLQENVGTRIDAYKIKQEQLAAEAETATAEEEAAQAEETPATEKAA